MYKLKLKGTGPIKHYLGCDFNCKKDGTLHFSPKKYIDKIINIYIENFGSKPKVNVSSPLEKGDHPELELLEFLESNSIYQYKSLIGALK